jgi:hypothetical protein
MTKSPLKPTGVAVKIPRRSYAIVQRLAKSEQRTITTTIERAIEHYRAATEGSHNA